jgi:hypothetical protein
VVGVCNVSSILAGALDAAIPARTRVTIFDGEGDVGSLTPVFDTQGPHVGSSQGRPVRIDGAFVHTAQLTLPMRTWTVVVRPSENYSSPIERAAEYMFLVAGLAGSLLVYGLLVSSRMRNTMIEWNVENRTRELAAEITVGGLPVVARFRTELFRLFQNLLSNAIKFRSDAPLKIEINCREDDAGATILVADNGIGVMPEHRDKIFGVFQRLHRRELYEGTGIGLAICVKIVEQMGGDITIEGNEGGGSIFVFTLPHSRLPGRQVLD